jgi:PAS domain S-box-containing protein
MDVAEVDAPVARLGWEMVWLIALIAIANATGAGLIWRDRQLRIYRESENHLRQVANETPAYLWMTAKGGENIFINRPLAEFLGTNKEVLDKDWRQYFHPEDAQRVFDKFFGCVALHAEFIDEHRLRRFDGEYRWFIGIGRPRFSAEKEFLGYAGSLFDITERKAAQDRSREIAELMEGQNRVLELIAQDAPLQSTLDALVRVIEALSSETLGSILLLDRDGVRLCHGAAPNLPEWYVKAIDGEPIGPVAGSCGTAAFRRQPVIVEDIAMDPLWENYRELALSHGLRACWSTPIFDERGAEGQNVLGVFAFYFRSPRRPTPRHRELIEMATHTAAVAICRAREKQDLWKSEERLRLATGYGRLGVWEWQVDTNRIIWSEGVKSIFGWNQGADDLTYEKFVTAIHPDDRNWVVQAVRRALAKHADYDAEHRICLADGSVRWIASHGRAQYGPTDEPLRMLGVTQDITERKQAEEEIGRRDAQLVEAQRIAHVGSYEWDIQANKLYRSAELYNIFGLLPEEFAPTLEGYLERVHREDRDSTKKLIEQAFREGKPFDHEERIIRSDGRVRTLHSQGRVVCDDEGRPQTLVGICQDITDRKQAEHQLQTAYAALAEQLREKGRAEKEIQALNARLITAQEEERSRLARELHDDFSQQIAGLSISLSNLRRGIPSEFAHVRSQSELIQERLTHLGEGIRRVSHELHPAMLEYSGLDTAIRAYCSEFAALGGIQVGFRSEGSFVDLPPEIALSAYRIAQEALQNILKHAQTKQAEVTLTQSQDVVRLTVSDHGIGMDKTRMSGGLGLTSMRERARLVNGTVVFQTGPGQGTTVTLTIPVPATPCQKSKIAKARGS